MRRGFLILGLAVGAGLAAFWGFGGLAALEAWATEGQRALRATLAGTLRALRAGEPGALAALLTVCFAYGFFHAAGPGHGKVLIGAYGTARRVPLLRLTAIALAASLAQATVAVAVVYAGVWVFDWTRDRIQGIADDVLPVFSYAAVAGVGLWLAWRGWRGVRRGRGRADVHGHAHGDHHGHGHDHHHTHHHHDHADDCGCGHAHGPTVEEVAKAAGWRDATALVAGIAMRPCSGALLLLVLTWQMGIGGLGVVGSYAMGLGTASVTVAVAALAVWAREGAFAALPGGRVARALPVVELTVGVLIAAVSVQLLLRAV